MDTVVWIGLSIAIFAGFLTLTKKNITVSDRLLAGWLFLLAFDYGNIGITNLYLDFAVIPSSFFLFNPAFYLYSKSLTNKKFKLKWSQLLHLFPYVFFDLCNHFFSISVRVDNFFAVDSMLWLRLLFAISFIISLLTYSTLSIVAVHKHRIFLKNEFSNIDKNQKLSWLLFIVISYSVYIITATVLGVLGFLNNSLEISSIYNYVATLILTFVLGFYGIRQDEIFTREIEKPIVHEKYQQSMLSDEKKEKIKEDLLKYFETQKPFFNSELNMQALSEKLGIPKYQITEVLNTVIGKNFFQFVNEFRVEAIKQKLADPNNNKFSLEAIGYDCGFSSKSSFFSVFKNISGQTPMQFKNSHS